MPPTNTSFATAVTIPSFPCDILQTDINDGGVNYTVFYRFIAPADARVIGAWGFSGNIGSGYRPTIWPYTGPAGAPTSVLFITAQNIPIQFPVNPGTEYFLEFRKNLDDAGPNEVRVRCEVAPLNPIARGNIVINDDTTGFPMAILSETTDFLIRNFVKGMPAGEAGDILDTPYGVMLLEENSDNSVRLIDKSFAQIFTSGTLSASIRLRRSAAGDKFYLSTAAGGVVSFRTVSPTGVMSGTTALTPITTINSLCADAAESILYYAANGANVPIRRWDIPGGAALGDLTAGVVNYRVPDILVLADGNICALYHDLLGGTENVRVKLFDTSGTLLQDTDLGNQGGNVLPRMGWALDNPNSVWVLTHDAVGHSIIFNVKVSDGSILATRIFREYEGGIYNGAETATPDARFGNSFSCPIFILTMDESPVSPSGIYVIVADRRNDNDIAIPTPTFKTALMP